MSLKLDELSGFKYSIDKIGANEGNEKYQDTSFEIDKGK
jgi:hypothetical protein